MQSASRCSQPACPSFRTECQQADEGTDRRYSLAGESTIWQLSGQHRRADQDRRSEGQDKSRFHGSTSGVLFLGWRGSRWQTIGGRKQGTRWPAPGTVFP